jgi:hypothetical protein
MIQDIAFTNRAPVDDHDEESSSLATLDVVNMAIARDDSCFSILDGAEENTPGGEQRPSILQQAQSFVAELNAVFSDDNSSVGVVEGTAVVWDGANVEVQQVWEESDHYFPDDDSFETKDSFLSSSSSSSQSFVSPGFSLDERIVYFREIEDRKKDEKKRKRRTLIQSSKLRISIVSIMNPEQAVKVKESRCRSLTRPLDLLEVENGTSAVVVQKAKLSKSLSAHIQAIAENPPSHMQFQSEVGIFGRLWRNILKRILIFSMDDINAERIGRQMQTYLPFLTASESYLLSQVIEALDQPQHIGGIFHQAFQNQIVSRIIVQAIIARYDFVFHWGFAVTWTRVLELLGHIPLVGRILRFSVIEKTPSKRENTLASIFRFFPCERCSSIRTFLPENPYHNAHNIYAASIGYTLANPSKYYAAQSGLFHTNDFHRNNALPTDDAILRTFVAWPFSTMTNYGLVITLRVLATHWHKMLTHDMGNFALQRQDRLNPFETLRFHMPLVLIALSSLRGRNKFDVYILGPLITALQGLKPSPTADAARKIVRKIDRDISYAICGGIPSVLEPFRSWLEAIHTSLAKIETEAKSIAQIVSRVELGIRLGHDIISQTSWKVPSENALKNSIVKYIRGQSICERIYSSTIQNTLEKFPPRDKRTIFALLQSRRLASTRPAKKLLARAQALLRREIRRKILCDIIRHLSKGKYVSWKSFVRNDWCWMENEYGVDLFIFRGKNPVDGKIQLLNVKSGSVLRVAMNNAKFREYIPVAEAIVRAQKALMTIELNHGKTFSYNAFMEFSKMRVALRRLLVIAQMNCDAIDEARLNILCEIKRQSNGIDNPGNMVRVAGRLCILG